MFLNVPNISDVLWTLFHEILLMHCTLELENHHLLLSLKGFQPEMLTLSTDNTRTFVSFCIFTPGFTKAF